MLSRVCVFLLSVTSIVANDEWLHVNTPQGPVRGRRMPNTEVFAFYSIPYATAPMGENKFKAPLPPPVWNETYDAVNRLVLCPQLSVLESLPITIQREDCLVANVFVPDTKEKNLSVLVYVHGGGFSMGTGSLFSAVHLMENKDIIFVTFNYRLNIHGFLCLGTDDAPGNAGIKDQVALLRWVRQNIASFGGNPDDVTLGGCSAGSFTADLIILSKLAEGLFHKAIPESGGNLGALAIQRDPLERAKSHAKTLNFTNVDDIYALEKFYKTMSIELLTSETFSDRKDSVFGFSPCVERDTGNGAFLTETPLNIFKKGNYKKIPILYGFADMEGLLRIPKFDNWKHKMNEKFSDFLPVDLKFKSEEEKEEVAAQIKRFYFGDKPVGNDSVLGYIDFFSDLIFTYPKLRAVKLHAEAGNNQVYLYEYSFVDDDTPLVPHTNIRGADHCAQSAAVLDIGDESRLSPEFRNMKRTMREIWRNFIKTGKPIPEGSSLPAWPPAGANRSPHMVLNTTLELKGVLLEERTRLWEEIYEKYYEDAVPPPTPPPRPTPTPPPTPTTTPLPSSTTTPTPSPTTTPPPSPTPNGGFGTAQLKSSALLFVSVFLYILQRN